MNMIMYFMNVQRVMSGSEVYFSGEYTTREMRSRGRIRLERCTLFISCSLNGKEFKAELTK